MTSHRAPEPCEYHESEGGIPHEWAPVNASEQECMDCGTRRDIPADCIDCQSLDDCRAKGHG